jgi:RNA polymerase sigma factor for flagellar operon FliA
MLDGVRNSDPGTKHVRRSMRSVELAIHELRHDLGRSPSEEEVANALAIPLLDYQRLLQKAHGYTVLSLEDLADGGSTEEFLQACMSAQADPLAVLERRELQRRLVFAIAGLSAREREVVRLMLEENFSSRRIGEHLGLSESRISQIRTQAIANLRAAIFGSDEHPAVLKPRRRTRTVGNQG